MLEKRAKAKAEKNLDNLLLQIDKLVSKEMPKEYEYSIRENIKNNIGKHVNGDNVFYNHTLNRLTEYYLKNMIDSVINQGVEKIINDRKSKD
jgi:hypothetical protein